MDAILGSLPWIFGIILMYGFGIINFGFGERNLNESWSNLYLFFTILGIVLVLIVPAYFQTKGNLMASIIFHGSIITFFSLSSFIATKSKSWIPTANALSWLSMAIVSQYLITNYNIINWVEFIIKISIIIFLICSIYFIVQALFIERPIINPTYYNFPDSNSSKRTNIRLIINIISAIIILIEFINIFLKLINKFTI